MSEHEEKKGYEDNELVDASQLAYIDMYDIYSGLKEDCSAEGKTSFTLQEIYDYGLKYGEDVSAIETMVKDGKLTADQMQNWEIVDVFDDNDNSGMYGCIIYTGDGDAIVAFRGSETLTEHDNIDKDWVRADMGKINSTLTPQEAAVIAFLEKNKDTLAKYNSWTTTGHSLGGSLAVFAAIYSVILGLDGNLAGCYSLDGPGNSDEFMELYKDEIAQVSDRVTCYIWSWAGVMLPKIPGADVIVLATIGGNCLTKHSLEYLDIRDGKFVEGELGAFEKGFGKITSDIDNLPKWLGDSIVGVVKNVVLVSGWLLDKVAYEDKEGMHLTEFGEFVAAVVIIAFVGSAIVVGVVATITVVLTIAAKILAVILFAILINIAVHLAKEILERIVAVIARALEWTVDIANKFLEMVNNCLKGLEDFYNSIFNDGYKYAMANPEVVVDTGLLREHAKRLDRINNRLEALGERVKRLYQKEGYEDLYNLMRSDYMIKRSKLLSDSAKYLRDTADDYEKVEREIISKLSEK